MALRSRWIAGAAAAATLSGSWVGTSITVASAAPTREWGVDIGPVGRSSPLAVDLDGNGDLEIVIGSQDSNLYALRPNGSRLWAAQAAKPIESSPAAADTDGDGKPELFVGSGSSLKANLQGGRLHSFSAAGIERAGWPTRTDDPPQESAMVESTPAIADTTNDGVADIVVGTSGLSMASYNQSGGRNWSQFTDDSVTSSPALADVNNDGVTDVVIGGDSSAGGPIDKAGGVIRAFNGIDGGVLWQTLVNEVVVSSPAIGDVDGDGNLEIVVGSGRFYGNAASDDLRIMDLATGNIERTLDLNADALAGPSLADVDGNGILDIVMGTWNGASKGRVWVFNGNGTQQAPFANGKSIPGGHIIEGSIVAAQLDGQQGQDLVVATSGGPYAFSGNTGNLLFENVWNRQRTTIVRMQNSPLIADLDNDGRLDIVLAGVKENGGGVVERYEIDGGSISAASWPMFHRDNRRTGSTANVPLTRNLCVQRGGYWMVARDGGIFGFCDARFHGSTGAQRLNQPIVGMAPTPDGGGYWLVASDGGIFAFGNAVFYGSTGATTLNQPIVGMARTRSGRGYWLVARDGGIFAFGDARFHGSAGATRLNQPIVGMAASPSGNGYYLVASDGGIFAYGTDAPFHGSAGGTPLNLPIVGMALAPGGGYWLVARDGGIFAYGPGAAFHGSTGAIRLNQPIVGMAPTLSGNGYYLVASDGGIFAFPGGTPFFGSTGAVRLNQPIVGMAIPGA